MITMCRSIQASCANTRDWVILCCVKTPTFCDNLFAWFTGRTPTYRPVPATTELESVRTEQPRAAPENDPDAFLDIDVDSLAAALE